MRLLSFSLVASVILAGLLLTGCPREPALSVSTKALHFGVDPDTNAYVTERTFAVWNSGHCNTVLGVSVSADKDWIEVTPAYAESSSQEDRIVVTVRIDRAYSMLKTAPEYASGTVEVSAPNGVQLVAVTTAPEYYTESFDGSTDLEGMTLRFTPNAGPSFYGLEVLDAGAFPVDPAGGAVLDFDVEGDPICAGLLGEGECVPFYEVDYDVVYVSSQGWISFGAPGNTASNLGSHFAVPQISALAVSASGGDAVVSYLKTAENLVITYENAPTQGTPGFGNNVQVEIRCDGIIQITYLDVDPLITGVAGLSSGAGVNGGPPPDFVESDLRPASSED